MQALDCSQAAKLLWLRYTPRGAIAPPKRAEQGDAEREEGDAAGEGATVCGEEEEEEEEAAAAAAAEAKQRRGGEEQEAAEEQEATAPVPTAAGWEAAWAELTASQRAVLGQPVLSEMVVQLRRGEKRWREGQGQS